MSQSFSTDVLIVGGGIAGLWLNARLRQQGRPVPEQNLQLAAVVADRLGGRVLAQLRAGLASKSLMCGVASLRIRDAARLLEDPPGAGIEVPLRPASHHGRFVQPFERHAGRGPRSGIVVD